MFRVFKGTAKLLLDRPKFSYARSASKTRISRERQAFFNQRELKTVGAAFQSDVQDAASVVQATQDANAKRASRATATKKLDTLRQLRDVLKANLALAAQQPDFSTERFPVPVAEKVLFARHKRLEGLATASPIDAPSEEGITLKEYCEARLADTIEQISAIGDPFDSDTVGGGLSMWNSRLGCFANVSSYPLTARHMSGFGFLHEVPAAWRRKSVHFVNVGGRTRFRMTRFIDQEWRLKACHTIDDPPADWIKPHNVKKVVDVFLYRHKRREAAKLLNVPRKMVRTWRPARADFTYMVKGERKFPYVNTISGASNPKVARTTRPSQRKRKWAFLVYLDAIGRLLPNRVPYWFTSPFRSKK